MTEGDQAPITPRSSRWVWLVVSTGMMIAAGVLLVQKVETFDSYCGSVLYDTNMSSPCGHEMSWRRLVAGILLVGAIATLTIAVALGRNAGEISHSLILTAGVVVMIVGILVAANRFLQPAEDWCGSVMNRHRTYEHMLEQHCDDRLRPHLAFGLLGGWIALCGLATAVWAGVRLRSPKD